MSVKSSLPETNTSRVGEHNAAEHGFSPDASGQENTKALQQALDQGGAVWITQPGIYDIGGTVFIGSHTNLIFGRGVYLRKVDPEGPFTHVFLNKGALSKTWDEAISITGLNLIVNGVDQGIGPVYGLRGQLAFFYARDVRIKGFRCQDLDVCQFGIHVCTFEDLVVADVVIRGKKDGIHLGSGKRFTIRDCVFQTHDDAIALNAHDYATSNPELGWIEDGVVENCHDLAEPDGKRSTGFFCRILAGGWGEWQAGMQVRQSDTVISGGRLYRVHAQPDGSVMTSLNRPSHTAGLVELDGIPWAMVQTGTIQTAGVRNVIFRDIFLRNPRTSFSIHFDDDRYSRSYRSGAPLPVQQNIHMETVAVLHDEPTSLISITCPVDMISIHRARLRRNGIVFSGHREAHGDTATLFNLVGCVFEHEGDLAIVRNDVDGKEVRLQTSGSVVLHGGSHVATNTGNGTLAAVGDLFPRPRLGARD